jgi:hypothetical protein
MRRDTLPHAIPLETATYSSDRSSLPAVARSSTPPMTLDARSSWNTGTPHGGAAWRGYGCARNASNTTGQ